MAPNLTRRWQRRAWRCGRVIAACHLGAPRLQILLAAIGRRLRGSSAWRREASTQPPAQASFSDSREARRWKGHASPPLARSESRGLPRKGRSIGHRQLARGLCPGRLLGNLISLWPTSVGGPGLLQLRDALHQLLHHVQARLSTLPGVERCTGVGVLGLRRLRILRIGDHNDARLPGAMRPVVSLRVFGGRRRGWRWWRRRRQLQQPLQLGDPAGQHVNLAVSRIPLPLLAGFGGLTAGGAGSIRRLLLLPVPLLLLLLLLVLVLPAPLGLDELLDRPCKLLLGGLAAVAAVCMLLRLGRSVGRCSVLMEVSAAIPRGSLDVGPA